MSITPAVLHPPANPVFVQPRVWTKTTKACVEYLTAHKAGDEAAKFEAFQHLTAILLRANHGIYIPRSVASAGNSEKYDFVQAFLLETLAPFLNAPVDVIEAAADADVFRYLGRRCRQRVLDKIRAVTRLRRAVRFVSYSEEFSEHQPKVSPPLIFEELAAFRGKFTFLTQASLETAMALFDVIGEATGSRKLGEALAVRRGVSIVTARRDLRNLRKEFQAALKSGDLAAKELFERLAEPIRTAQLLPRDLPFWADGETEYRPGENPGSIHSQNAVTGEAIQFEGFFRKYRHQDDAAEFDWAELAEFGYGQ